MTKTSQVESNWSHVRFTLLHPWAQHVAVRREQCRQRFEQQLTFDTIFKLEAQYYTFLFCFDSDSIKLTHITFCSWFRKYARARWLIPDEVKTQVITRRGAIGGTGATEWGREILGTYPRLSARCTALHCTLASVTRWVWGKDRPKCIPNHFLAKIYTKTDTWKK
jgi:hypothetical protein